MSDASADYFAALDRLLLILTRRNMALEGVVAAAVEATAYLQDLAAELEVLNLAEGIEFAELEESFWASYAHEQKRGYGHDEEPAEPGSE